ncbi:MAG: hypothetical protein WC406_02325 [Methanoregula sp.]
MYPEFPLALGTFADENFGRVRTLAKSPYRTKLSTSYYINFVNLKISVLQQREKGIFMQKHVADRILFLHTEEGDGSAAPEGAPPRRLNDDFSDITLMNALLDTPDRTKIFDAHLTSSRFKADASSLLPHFAEVRGSTLRA